MFALNAANYSYPPLITALKVQKTALLLRVQHIVRNFMQIMFLACTCILPYTQACHIKIIWHICKTGIRCTGAKKSAPFFMTERKRRHAQFSDSVCVITTPSPRCFVSTSSSEVLSIYAKNVIRSTITEKIRIISILNPPLRFFCAIYDQTLL